MQDPCGPSNKLDLLSPDYLLLGTSETNFASQSLSEARRIPFGLLLCVQRQMVDFMLS